MLQLEEEAMHLYYLMQRERQMARLLVVPPHREIYLHPRSRHLCHSLKSPGPLRAQRLAVAPLLPHSVLPPLSTQA